MSNFKYKIGDIVTHDYSGGKGEVVALRGNEQGYCYGIEWENGRTDYYKLTVIRPLQPTNHTNKESGYAERELGKQAQEALKYYRKNPNSLEWIALDAFRIWHPKQYWFDDGTAGFETVVTEFQLKEVKA